MFDLVMKGYTTSAIDSPEFMKGFIDDLRSFLGTDDIIFHQVIQDKGAKAIPLKAVSEKELLAAYKAGGLPLSGGSRYFDAGLTWRRLTGDSAQRHISNLGFTQNEITLSLRSDVLEGADAGFHYLRFVERQALRFNVNYLFVCDPANSNIRFKSNALLGAGLQDIHWVNIFGPPYLEMFKESQLLESPAFSSRKIGPGHIFIQTTETYSDPNCRAFQDAKREIMAYLGPNYFVKNETIADDNAHVLVNFFNPLAMFKFLKQMRATSKEMADTSHCAKIRPKFDFKNIFPDFNG